MFAYSDLRQSLLQSGAAFAYGKLQNLPVLQLAPVASQEKPAALPIPPRIKSASSAKTPSEILAGFLGVPFREDGVIDEHGNFTLFSRPDTVFKEPGLNCSGFMLSASRLLLRKNIPLAAAARDRMGDSGAGAALGRDWDFGWDVVLNTTQGMERKLLLPDGAVADPAAGSGLAPLGFELHSPKTWQELPGRIRRNHLYFVSFSRTTKQRGYSLLHYHVGILVRASDKDWHLYHSVKTSGVVRENMGNEQSLAKFLHTNRNVGDTNKHMFIVEVPCQTL